MTRVSWLLAALPALVCGQAACSKFNASDDGPGDAGAPEAAVTDTGAPPQPHRIYVYGGVGGPGASPITSAWVSTVGADGELGEWTAVPKLANDRTAAAWAQGGRTLLAAAGGVSPTALSMDGTRTDLTDDPASLQGWTTITMAKTAHQYPAAAAFGTSFYVSGGRDATKALANIERYDSTANMWLAAGSLPQALAGHTSFVRNAKMYVVGGDTLSTPAKLSDGVMRTALSDSDGSVGAWEDANHLKAAVAHHAMALVEPYLFVIGGDGSGNTAIATVQIGTFDADGLLSWDLGDQLDVPTAQTGLAEACAVVIDHTIYVMGGRDRADAASKDSVYIGRVDAKGAVKWAASKTTLREPRAAFGCAVTP